MFFDKKNAGDKQAFSAICIITDEEVTKMSKGMTEMSYADRSIYIFFHSNNCRRRVIHLGMPFYDRECLQAETNQVVGKIVRLSEDESTRLANKIQDLEEKFRSLKGKKGRRSVEGRRLSQREVAETAMREVFAGVRAFDHR